MCRGSVYIYCTRTCVGGCVHATARTACTGMSGNTPDLPFGGGLTSVSPCWFELSDCPDCSEREKEEKKREGDG